MSEYPYTLIRSRRRTISMEISNTLQIIVRAPLHMKSEDIALFVNKHSSWIEKHLNKKKNQTENAELLTPQQADLYKATAKKVLPEKTAYFAKLMGVSPTSVKITSAKKRFGSCSGKNRICYSWYLMAYPNAAIDYVVVHELAHIKYKNHGKEFYAFIKEILPDYKERIALLK